MKKQIFITVISFLALVNVMVCQTALVTTMSVSTTAQPTLCVGATVVLSFNIQNNNTSTVTFIGDFKAEFGNSLNTSPIIIGISPSMTITLAANATSPTYTILATIPSLPNGLNHIRVDYYMNGTTDYSGGLPNPPQQVYVLNPPTTPTITPSGATAICQNSSVQLTASGATSYSWSTGATTPTISVSAANTYTVKAINQCGTASNSVAVTVNPLPTVTATSNTTSLCTGSTATLTANGANTYTWSTGSTYDTTLVSPIVNATYTVTGTDANGCNNIAIISQTVTNCSTTGVEQLTDSNEQVNIYPNPASTSLTLTLSKGDGTLMQVYDVNGKLVLSQTISGKTSIDASTLNEGVYNISLQSNEGVINKRLVIVR